MESQELKVALLNAESLGLSGNVWIVTSGSVLGARPACQRASSKTPMFWARLTKEKLPVFLGEAPIMVVRQGLAGPKGGLSLVERV